MDKPAEGREDEQPKDPNAPTAPPATHNKSTIRKPLPPVEAAAAKKPGFELLQTVPGNEMTVLVQMLSSINQNIAFLARTIHDYLHPDDKGKDISKKV